MIVEARRSDEEGSISKKKLSKKSNKEARKARIEGNRKRRKFSRNKKRLERQEAKLHAPGKDLISTLWRTHCFTQNINELLKLIFIQN